jgi:aspartate-semialdehyde dehydrogenase
VITVKKGVVVLGATGLVGQRIVSMLQKHPWFELAGVAASEKSSGRKYGEAVSWHVETPLDSEAARMTLMECTARKIVSECDADFVFSCLPGGLAKTAEQEFAREGLGVFSKASDNRMEPDVPLIVPEVNPEHTELIRIQRERRGWSGFITTDPNCSTTQLVLSLFPLKKYGLKRVVVSTMQALSGAGYPGVASLDAVGNVIPFIGGEEEKVEREPKKILGSLQNGAVKEDPVVISASCNRVPVADGHMETVVVELEKRPSVEELKKTFDSFTAEPQKLRLPSAVRPIVVRNENDRPQPKRDLFEGNGMSVIIGRIRRDPVLGVKYTCLAHNLVRGAAGNGMLQAELFAAKKLV